MPYYTILDSYRHRIKGVAIMNKSKGLEMDHS